MEAFTVLEAPACPLGLANVDTDQLIPARFMKRSRAEGYGGFCLHDLRFDEEGRERPGFPLNDPRHSGARILVARRNFGTGSSREAAVYALWDYGVRCVIAPSFGDIFASNAVKNGLLPAQASEEACEAMLARIERQAALSDGPVEARVDLESCTIRLADVEWPFVIDPVRRLQLLNGWDDLDLTLRHEAEIAAFREARRKTAPWAAPAG